MTKIIPVILCGGSGKRLWPLSRKNKPKQFLRLDSGASLLQETIARAKACSEANFSDIVTVTTHNLEKTTRQHLGALHFDLNTHIVVEKAARNTAPAIALAAEYVSKNFDEDCALWILPSDHKIDNVSTLKATLETAMPFAQKGKIITFGVKPKWPETGYGYIKTDNQGHITEFTEKPNLEKAKQFITSGNYFWNSGMFLASVQTIKDQFKIHIPGILESNEVISFDNAIMEKTDKAHLIPLDAGWADIGTWSSLWKYRKQKRKAA